LSDIVVVIVGVNMRLDPATIAEVQSPICRARQASCKPTRDDEHPVWKVILDLKLVYS
jgi:hypothetical protein